MEIVGLTSTQNTKTKNVQMFRTLLKEGQAGQNVEISLESVEMVMPDDNLKLKVELLSHWLWTLGYALRFERTSELLALLLVFK